MPDSHDRASKEAHSVDVAIPNSHSSITEKLQKYTDLKEELITIWQLNAACIIPLVLSITGIIPINAIHNGIIPNKLHDSLKLLNLRPALYIPMHKAVILNTCCIARKLLAE
jgi:hypothetical protein